MAVIAGAMCVPVWAQIVRIKDRAEVTGSHVLLGDVATISGLPEEQAESFKRVPLCASPLPGISKNVEADYLIARARQQGVPVDSMDIEGAGRVNVKALVGNMLTPDDLTAMLEEYIRSEMPWPYDEAEISCHPTGQPLKLPGGEIKISIRHQPEYGFVGEGVFPATVYSDGRRVRSLFLKAHVEVYKPIVVARTHIPRGGAFTEDTTTMQTVPLSSLRGGYYLASTGLAGLQARREIRPGTVITTDMVERPVLIRRGEDVMLTCETASLQVAVKMQARTTGRLGDVITVENPSSRKVLCAVVTGPGEVELR